MWTYSNHSAICRAVKKIYANNQSINEKEAKNPDPQIGCGCFVSWFQPLAKSPRLLSVILQTRCLHESNNHHTKETELGTPKDRPRSFDQWYGSYCLHSGNGTQFARALGGRYSRGSCERPCRSSIHDRSRTSGLNRCRQKKERSQFVRC